MINEILDRLLALLILRPIVLTGIESSSRPLIADRLDRGLPPDVLIGTSSDARQTGRNIIPQDDGCDELSR